MLFAGGAVSQEVLDKTQMTFEVARSQLTQTEEQYRLVKSGPRRERIEAQRSQLEQVEAVLDNMTIRAPSDGVVTVRHREPGETAGAGAPVLSVLEPSSRWVRIYVREDRVAAVRLGMPATITTDTYRDRTYPGEVVFVASQAEFTPKNVQTTEERVKLVYAVKVQVAGDDAFDLKPGMPADVRLALEKR
jgi:HlyD family secretion protein